MLKILKITLLACVVIASSTAEEVSKDRDRLSSVRKVLDSFGTLETKVVSTVNTFTPMFTDGKVSGQVRSVYAGYDQKQAGAINTYATALGGQLKYELASLHGFNAAFAFATSQDLSFMTGDKDSGKHNDELSSSTGDYTELSEAYINYRYGGFNLRAGKQILDTPLADSDDIRMIPNTFEAYMATYELDDFMLTAGNIQKWQGVDAGLDDGWVATGDTGTWLGGISYSDTVRFDAWYYNITEFTNALYADVGSDYAINKDMTLYVDVQYLRESELSNSGYEASIYGGLVELVAYGAGINLAYNKSDKIDGKKSFSGIGGGYMYTSMDTMIIDEITEDRDARAIVASLVYDIGNWELLYAYGDFSGDENSAGQKVHIVEQDISLTFNVTDEFVIAAIYVKEDDQENTIKTEYDWDRVQVMVKYDF